MRFISGMPMRPKTGRWRNPIVNWRLLSWLRSARAQSKVRNTKYIVDFINILSEIDIPINNAFQMSPACYRNINQSMNLFYFFPGLFKSNKKHHSPFTLIQDIEPHARSKFRYYLIYHIEAYQVITKFRSEFVISILCHQVFFLL